MTTDNERSLQRETVRLMLAVDDLANNLAEVVGGNARDLVDDALDKGGEVTDLMPDTFIDKLLRNQKIIREVTIDVDADH